MNLFGLLTFILLSFLIEGIKGSKWKTPLNSFILDYDVVEYNAHHVHHKVKRHIEAIRSSSPPPPPPPASTSSPLSSSSPSSTSTLPSQGSTGPLLSTVSPLDPIQINFKAKGKIFNLSLKPEVRSAFSETLIVEDSSGKPITINFDHIVSGQLENEPGHTKVYGSIHDGVFEGKIHTLDQTYYVERVGKYGKDFKEKGHNVSSHSIIYSADDVHHDHDHEIGAGCGNDEIYKWMEEISNSAVPEPDGKKQKKPIIVDDEEAHHHNYYSEPVKTVIHHRSKRDSSSSSFQPSSSSSFEPSAQRLDHKWFGAEPRIAPDKSNNLNNNPTPNYPREIVPPAHKRACSLYIQTDTYLWDHIRKDVSSDTKAREEIASLVAQHIKAVNHIYESANFQGIRGLKFIVQRLKINESTACDDQSKRDQNPFCSPNIDVSNFLNLNSQFNHNDFCLAYIFTYRDFSGGTLGLAWVASTSGASGGICEKYKSYTENIHGRQVQTKRSLNTGIITFVNYNSRVPPKVSELTLAHEIGHNFGSPHDFPPACRPGGAAGNYIMYSSATSGERANNNKFSPCSVRNISAVLTAVFHQEGKENCFEIDNGAFCGNKIVEEGEECDCGYDVKECTEQCCYPREYDVFLNSDPDAKPCKRRSRAYCSPSEGPCCNEQCGFERPHKICRYETECTFLSFCDGKAAQCPLPPAKPDKTECNGGTQVCLRGTCSGSICQKYDMEECFLTFKNGAKPDEMCEVACQRHKDPKSCRRTSEIEQMRNISGLKLRPGSPCNDFQGYCDVFQRCRAVDAEGPLARLKNLLWNHKTLLTIKQWATTYWWACMLMAIAILLFMAAFIKCCAVHTPSSNPKKRPALKITDTLRRPADTLRRKRPRSTHSRPANQSSSSSSHGANIPLQPSAPLFSDVSINQPSSSSSSSYNQTSCGLNMQHTQLVVALPPESHGHSSGSGNGGVGGGSLNYSSNSSDPPPPYPGLGLGIPPPPPPISRIPTSNSSGPSHGYGEGRGHYNRKGQTNVPTGNKGQPNNVPSMPKSHHNSVSSRSRHMR
ncbi:disintegrin and metalloproteinase domain-containing protein 10-like [Panonychus citri]|uniref:disintegrin and metalloproteinase domain-containing protein 10-like n=1 Tax=Panonychus citri TaxID=50023 RepID=UPI002308181A|nr:disintegrin and metalloproteinase domain-containing protein 10-like [Panonychus citri]